MSYSFIPSEAFYRTPKCFNYEEYAEIEQEIWMLFPETQGKRANFIQFGLSALLLVEVPDDKSEIGSDEAYFMMPCPGGHLQPIRMKTLRHLTLDEYRMASYSSIKLAPVLEPLRFVMREIGATIAGEEFVEDLDRINNTD